MGLPTALPIVNFTTQVGSLEVPDRSATLTGTGLLLVSCLLILGILSAIGGNDRPGWKQSGGYTVAVLILVGVIAMSLSGIVQEFTNFSVNWITSATIGTTVFILTILLMLVVNSYRRTAGAGKLVIYGVLLAITAPLVPLIGWLMSWFGAGVLQLGEWIINLLPN